MGLVGWLVTGLYNYHQLPNSTPASPVHNPWPKSNGNFLPISPWQGACEARRPALSEALSLAELGLALRVLPGVQMTTTCEWCILHFPKFPTEFSEKGLADLFWVSVEDFTLHDLLILFCFCDSGRYWENWS